MSVSETISPILNRLSAPRKARNVCINVTYMAFLSFCLLPDAAKATPSWETFWETAEIVTQFRSVSTLHSRPDAIHRYKDETWQRIKHGRSENIAELGDLLDTALLLHQALPESGFASQRALNRLALYQAKARAFGTVRFLKNIRHRLGRPPLTQTEVPGNLVRDLGLPAFCRQAQAPRRK
jgi:hypothetical protein